MRSSAPLSAPATRQRVLERGGSPSSSWGGGSYLLPTSRPPRTGWSPSAAWMAPDPGLSPRSNWPLLQSLVDPEEQLELDGRSDAEWRERIGNSLPLDD